MDFALIMLIALLVTGLIWGLDHLLWAPVRRRAAEALLKAGQPETAVEQARREPLGVE